LSTTLPENGRAGGDHQSFAGYVEPGESFFPELVAARERMLERLLRARSPRARLELVVEAAACGLVVEATPEDDSWGDAA